MLPHTLKSPTNQLDGKLVEKQNLNCGGWLAVRRRQKARTIQCVREVILKSILFTLLIFLLASSAIAEPVEVKPPQTKVLGTSTGRYVFGQISDFRSDQFLLDTATGRLWQLVIDDKQNKKMQPVPIIQLLGEEANVPEPLERDEQWREHLRADTIKKIQEAQKTKQ